jgi:hypothetical protein
MSNTTLAFIPAQVRSQVANLLEQCMYCGGSGVEADYGDDSGHMSACHACNGEGLTVRTDAALILREMYDALAEVNAALDRTACVDAVKPDSYANVRLSGKQIAAVRAAIAKAGTTPATDATATNLTPSSLRVAPNLTENSEGRDVISALDGAVNLTLARTREEELEACFLGIQRNKRDCAVYAHGSEAYVRALESLQVYQALMLKACDNDFSILRAATAGTRAW